MDTIPVARTSRSPRAIHADATRLMDYPLLATCRIVLPVVESAAATAVPEETRGSTPRTSRGSDRRRRRLHHSARCGW